MGVRGWPFLIARGRQRGYSVLLAPEFLLADYGFLEEATGPVPASEPFRAAEISHRGRRVHLVWAEHRVTSADLDGAEPRDEHSRPLLLLYGVLSLDTPVAPDLRHALRIALDTYRRFLADEDGFTVEPSGSPVAPPPALSSSPSPSPPAPRPHLGRRLVIGTALAMGVAVTAVVVAISAGSDETPPPPCPRPTTEAKQPATPTCTPTTTPPRPRR